MPGMVKKRISLFFIKDEDRRAKDERMRKFMTAADREKKERGSDASRGGSSSGAISKDSSAEMRNKRKELEKQAMEYEDKLKRKRDRSAEGK